MANNIKPILGVQITVRMYDFDLAIVLIAKNDAGYQNIIQITSWAQTHREKTIP